MAAFWTTLWRQIRAYGGGHLVAATVIIVLDSVLVQGDQGWPRLGVGRFSFDDLPVRIIEATIANAVFFLLPFLLVRWFVVMTSAAMSGRVGPIAAAVSGAVPAVVTIAWLSSLFGNMSDMDAKSLVLTSVGGAVCGLVYRQLGGFPERIRP